MSNIYQQMTDDELRVARERLSCQADEMRARHLALDMARGKPSPAQVDLSRPMLSILGSDADLFDEGIDCANYGCFEGIPSARALGAELLGCSAEQCLVLGSSSLLIEHDILAMFWHCGTGGAEPWGSYSAAHDGVLPQVLCPVPGYDRHFGISENLGMLNIVVPMTETGPDMDVVERLVATDDSIKAIWCVPKYSNPTGITYSDEVVRRLVSMKTAAPDFKILWDNAYCVHDLYDTGDELANIFELARAAGHEERVVAFASTSKISFPGSGIAFVGASHELIAEFSAYMKAGLISADKLNQLRHTRFLPTSAALREHMAQHAALLRPRFELVETMLSEGLSNTGLATWTHPRGGYFVSFNGPVGSARRIVALAKELGVTLTPAGATFPAGQDFADCNIRIAPSYPSLEDLRAALEVLVLATHVVGAELAAQERGIA
ncbi:aminotransferase [Collinsella sp. zg1085]|uniref:PLP-dependent aminotransferase family protein n=1 Tax=Collinsella sp. zg1085 TaxID=2844380 RepID=UPI001C0E8803|nr:PLP-dependent aminotransferase family protein [Collinsella sp. zg1085]QWT17383.1 aminotransferase [Collinsella sp. zg1085]